MAATVSPEARHHEEYVADDGVAYRVTRVGRAWLLRCAWCTYEAPAFTRREALAAMQEHYNSIGAVVELY